MAQKIQMRAMRFYCARRECALRNTKTLRRYPYSTNTMATKRKRSPVASSNGASLLKKKKVPTKVVKPTPVEEDDEDDIDAMIAAEEAKAERETASGVTLADLAASDDEEVGNIEDNKYFKSVDEDPNFVEDEELQAYVESKKRGLLRPSVNNHKGLQKKLLEIIDGAPWPETLAITAEDDLECKDVQDDLARESAFYKQALWAAETGLELCEEFGMKHVRPTDYYAEMLKTDGHMYKVRQQIALDKKKIEIKEQRRTQRDALKYGKLIEKQKKKEKEDEKKKQKRITKTLKEKYEGKNNAKDDDFGMELEDEDEAQDGEGKPKGLQGLRGRGIKRRMKDEKFGTGNKGKKKGSKYNTKESYLGLEKLKVARKGLHNARRDGRPGKAKRAQAKSKRRH